MLRRLQNHITPTSAALSAALLASACVNANSPVPGLTAETTKTVTETDILDALRCQVATGLLEVDAIRKASDNPLARDLKYVSATGELTGEVKTENKGDGKIEVTIPLSYFPAGDDFKVGSSLGASLGGLGSATATEIINRAFDLENLDKVNLEDLQLCANLKAKGIDPGRFVADSMVAGFNTVLELEEGHQLTFKPKTQKVTAVFALAQTVNGGLALEIVPALKHAFSNAGITANTSTQVSRAWTLAMTLSTAAKQSGDNRRIISCQEKGGLEVCVEEDFSKERYEELIDAAREGVAVPPKQKNPTIQGLRLDPFRSGGAQIFGATPPDAGRSAPEPKAAAEEERPAAPSPYYYDAPAF